MSPLALVSAVSGIGDIVRVTPLVQVFRALGYEVDVLLSPDYVESVALLEGAPEIRRLWYTPSPWCADRRERLEGLAGERYAVATFTALGVGLRRRVRTDRALAFDPAMWRRDGDTACVRHLARLAGWDAPLPPPIVRHSGRPFDLAPGTVALHPGCKPAWGFKRWHGFEALAEQLPDVVVVGTEADLADDATAYFHRRPRWPSHVVSWIGRLALADTAALLSQCAAVVANDSGLLHVAAALGVPTFGIYGLTSPGREMMPLPNTHAITARLPCEAACRRRPWGRTDCEHHLRCLRTLDVDVVLARLLPAIAPLHRAVDV